MVGTRADMSCRSIFMVVSIAVATAIPAAAEWQPDGVPISTTPNRAKHEMVTPDGSGGVLMVWETNKVYAQRLSASGDIEWTPGGALVGPGGYPACCADGTGGLMVAWQTGLGFDPTRSAMYCIAVQKLDASGHALWNAPVDVVGGTIVQFEPRLVGDGDGGAIVAWMDFRDSVHYAIYAQHLDSMGNPLWGPNGVLLTGLSHANPSYQRYFSMVSDGAAGAIVTWWDGYGKVHVQRVLSDGSTAWGTEGILAFPAGNSQNDPVIASDEAGGAIVAWADRASGANDAWGLSAQRFSAEGTKLWGTNPVILSTTAWDITISEDGAGGAVFAWREYSSATGLDIRANKVDAVGVTQWGAGVAVCAAAGPQDYPAITTDQAGGAIVVWQDGRVSDVNIYGQIVSANGALQGAVDGFSICSATADQWSPTIAHSVAGKAIAAWVDPRPAAPPYETVLYASIVEAEVPTAVAIASFDAIADAGVVSLKCDFRSEFGAHHVNVYRGSQDGPLATIEHMPGYSLGHFEYIDEQVLPGHVYRYQIGVEDVDGEFLSPIVSVDVPALRGELAQNRPNPFHSTTTIQFVLAESEHVTISLYDARGRLVHTLVDGLRDAGPNNFEWNGLNAQGAPVAAGVYFYQLRAGSFVASKRMVVAR